MKFTDPVKTFIETNVFFQYNPDYTNLSLNALQEQVRNVITNYLTTKTGSFNQSFRRSNLLSDIDDVNPAVLSSRADVRMQQRFTPSSGVEQNISFSFPVSIAVPDDVNFIIESSIFKLNELDVKIRNRLNSNVLQVINQSTGQVVPNFNNIGTYNPSSGRVDLIGFKSDESKLIKLSCVPSNQSAIVPNREYILDFDATRLSAKGILTTARN